MNLAEFSAQLHSRARRSSVEHLLKGIEEPLYRYVELLRRWNATINLTALSLDPITPDTFDRLLIEPLAVATRLADVRGPWFDLGSGGGSPAIPIKVVLPHLDLTMVEARERKAAFLREAVRALGLGGTSVETLRFEALRKRAEFAGSAGLITVRAVRMDEEFQELCAYLLRDHGILVPIGCSGVELQGFTFDSETEFFRRKCST